MASNLAIVRPPASTARASAASSMTATNAPESPPTLDDVKDPPFFVGARQLVRQDGGVGRPILRCATAATHPDARTNWRAPTKYFGLSLAIASTAAVYLFVGVLALLAVHLAAVQGSSSKR